MKMLFADFEGKTDLKKKCCSECSPHSLTCKLILTKSVPKIVCRPGSIWTLWGAHSAPLDPAAGFRELLHGGEDRSTQPTHPCVGMRNEYQPKGGDALRLGNKGSSGS